MNRLTPGARLRAALADPQILVAPGAYDAISARLVQANGFQAVYVTGGGVTNALLGMPDVGLTTMTEMAGVVSRIADAVELPVFSDADTGYGTALNVGRTVRAFERAGLAGLHLEDQDGVKRCGHLEGKTVIPRDEMCAKIAAAVEARQDPDFQIIARTDAAAVEGVEGAVARASAYREAGADVIFPEALGSREAFATVAERLRGIPLLANMTEFGKTPLMSAQEFEQLGYAAVIFPMTAFRLMLRAVDDGLRALASAGTQRDLLELMRTRAELYELIDYDDFTRREQRYAAVAAGGERAARAFTAPSTPGAGR